MLPAQQNKVDSGNVDIEVENGDPFDDMDAVMDDTVPIQTTPSSPPVTDRRKNFNAKKNEKRQKAGGLKVNCEEFDKMLTDREWAIIEIIGRDGFSEKQEIEGKYNLNPPCKGKITSTNWKNLETQNVIKIEKVIVDASFNVYWLTETGKALYEYKYEKNAVKAEAEIILSDHTSFNHGYGIKRAAKILEKDENNKEVVWITGRQRIKTKNANDYIPDIICSNKFKSYYEYETGSTKPSDFIAKCNKMIEVTDILNFIGPNGKVVDDLKNKVDEWIKNKGIGALKSITVRITSVAQMKEKNLAKNESWKIVYTLKNGPVPHINF